MSGMSPLMMMSGAGRTGLSPEIMAGLEPQQVQGMLQMAALQGMMGCVGAGEGGDMKGGGVSPEVMQSMVQMAAMQGLPPAAMQGLVTSMAGGRPGEAGDNPWEQFIKQSLSASRAGGHSTGMTIIA